MVEKIVVDGCNVSHSELSEADDPNMDNLVPMHRVLHDLGSDPIVIVDASLWHEVDDPERPEED